MLAVVCHGNRSATLDASSGSSKRHNHIVAAVCAHASIGVAEGLAGFGLWIAEDQHSAS